MAKQSTSWGVRYTDAETAEIANHRGSHWADQGDGKEWDDIARTTCGACGEYAIWRKRWVEVEGIEADHKYAEWDMIWPGGSGLVHDPHRDMPEHLNKLYEEARAVLPASPRAAAALLRLLMEILLKEVKDSDLRLNDLIGELVAEGLLDGGLHEIADVLRISGNDAVHAAEIQTDGDDSRETVVTLFELLNTLVDEVIGKPNRRKAMFNRLPQSKREEIERRNEKARQKLQTSD